MAQLPVTVVGAGNGGAAFAAHLGIMGYEVKMLNRSLPRLEAVRRHGGIQVTDAIEGFGPVSLATLDPAEAIEGAVLIMVVVPATAHAFLATRLAPHLVDGQVIVLHPGRTGGALEFAAVLRREQCRARVLVAEAQSLLYACRVTSPGTVSIKGVKKIVPVAALPARHTPEVLEILNQAFPQFIPAKNVLETSLMNIGAVFHPAITCLNAARLDAKEAFKFYSDGVTPAVGRLIEAIDTERLAVAKRLGVQVESASEWLIDAYGVQKDSLYRMMNANEVYKRIDAPDSLDIRYLWEDVPTGLVPMVSLGELAGVPTPASRCVADLAGFLLGQDMWESGRTANNLGLADMGVDHVVEFVEEGQSAP
ncbi:MAG: NAD/NADP octopine/nopaline dehydrogenase family protein [Bacillota bacterium]